MAVEFQLFNFVPFNHRLASFPLHENSGCFAVNNLAVRYLKLAFRLQADDDPSAEVVFDHGVVNEELEGVHDVNAASDHFFVRVAEQESALDIQAGLQAAHDARHFFGDVLRCPVERQ